MLCTAFSLYLQELAIASGGGSVVGYASEMNPVRRKMMHTKLGFLEEWVVKDNDDTTMDDRWSEKASNER